MPKTTPKPKAVPTPEDSPSVVPAPDDEKPNFLSWPSSFGEMRHKLPSSQAKATAPWSESLQQQTRAALDELRMMPDGRLHMKHKVEGYAAIDIMAFQRSGRPVCTAKDGRRWEYPDVEALLTDGWVID